MTPTLSNHRYSLATAWCSRTRTALWALAGIGICSTAAAQDPEPLSKEPNVLLVVDTSGSMEYETGASTYPTCDPTGVSLSERSRWIEVVEVLTGTINDYRCDAVDRRSASFASEFQLPGGVYPPDVDYRNPYHRPLSGTCTVGPNSAALSALTNAFDWVSPANYIYDSPTSACASGFSQAADGLIDSLNDSMRFGLMTFDTLPDPQRGYAGGTYSALFSGGAAGAWSYFLTQAKGLPAGCTDPALQDVEVGARNGAAPAWEGKLIHFGDPNASLSQNQTRHERIQQVLLATRPYGATPIAGAMEDAKSFLTEDTTPDPLDTTREYGPKNDPFVVGGCRDQAIVLLTDGEPNLDLRPHCEGAGGTCPFNEPTTVAEQLANGTYPIKTHVLGFVDEITTSGIDCNAMDVSSATAPGGLCDSNPSDEELQVCCRLHEIAYKGDTDKAVFASNKADLKTRLSSILVGLIDGNASATQPVRSPSVSDTIGGETAVAYRFLTSYDLRSDGLWKANIERLRWTCPSGVPEEQAKNESVGDDFSENVDDNPTDRTFFTFIPSDPLNSAETVRPNLATGNEDGLQSDPGGSALVGDPTTFVGGMTAGAMKPDTTPGSSCDGLSDAACVDLILSWAVGLDNGSGEHRCASAGSENCSVIGDVMHSTPVLVDRPSAVVDDETYANFQANFFQRPMMMYTSSNDGMLHGFYVSPNDASDPVVDGTFNNEEFAFLPPAVLPLLQSQYPTTRQKLLDGIPVVDDVVATENPTNTYYPYKLERSSSGAEGASSTWRTILVQGFGGARSGYFAVDITEPRLASGGPTFLWQLTTDESGNPLFGRTSGKPVITTLNVEGVETAVAVLPGGDGEVVTGSCNRSNPAAGYANIESGFTPRAAVRCYAHDTANDGYTAGDDLNTAGARSLTIVRLDSGEVIRTFRRDPAEAPGLASATSSPYADGSNGLLGASIALPYLDSPITGEPAAFPDGTGAVADRIFVGDQDGGLWKVDVSETDPAQWTMELFFDAFAATTSGGAADEGRPIKTRPVLSFDALGQITVAFATGDQDLSGGPGEEQFVWSLTETVNPAGNGFITTVNWYQRLLDGEHVLGPIELVNGDLFYSTYLPPDPTSSAACNGGESEIWGVDYITPKDLTDRSQGGAGALNITGSTSSNTTNRTAAELGLSDDTLIFGVNIDFAPTCFTPDVIPNAVLGSSALIQNPSPPQMQLTFQTSNTSTSKDTLGFKTGFEAINLDPPRNLATIESWAPILE